MIKRLLSTVFITFIAVSAAFAQVGQGALKGKVVDKETGEPLPFVNVKI